MIEKLTKVAIYETKVLEYSNDYTLLLKKRLKIKLYKLTFKNKKNSESLFFFQIVVTSRNPDLK